MSSKAIPDGYTSVLNQAIRDLDVGGAPVDDETMRACNMSRHEARVAGLGDKYIPRMNHTPGPNRAARRAAIRNAARKPAARKRLKHEGRRNDCLDEVLKDEADVREVARHAAQKASVEQPMAPVDFG